MASYALKRKPRTRTIALTECISFNPSKGIDREHGTVITPPSNHVRLSDEEKAKRAKDRKREQVNRALDIINARDRNKSFASDGARFGYIGNID